MDENHCSECRRRYDVFDKFWIQCDNCKGWFHGDCVYVQPHQAVSLDKFHCFRCEVSVGPSICKPVTNNHRHNIYEEDPSPKIQCGTDAFLEMLKNREFDMGQFQSMQGNQLTYKYFLRNGFNEPILIDKSDGLDMDLPPSDFGVEQVMEHIGGYTELDVIDSKQQISIRIPLVQFARCLNMNRRNQTLNCISLEVSNTRLGSIIKPPGVVDKLSWVENGWPEVDMRPSVSKYCLMSMKDSYTDFHIDFGGTSVWYHILQGTKVFYLLEPTPANLDAYEKWMSRPDSSEVFLPDLLGNQNDCKMMILRQGQTLFIPTGWIHAVLTLKDSLVFGGNFLHSLNIKLQLQVYELENRLRTPDKFLFPYFELTNWYAVPLICKILAESFIKRPPPSQFIEGVEVLLTYLTKWQSKSKEENSCKNGDFSPYAPKGCINSNRIIKDLQKNLRGCLNRLKNPQLQGQALQRGTKKTYHDMDEDIDSGY